MSSVPLSLLAEDLDIHRHSDWVAFSDRLESAIHAGRARRIQPVRHIYARSEQWFVDTVSGEIYVYLEPDDRVLPEWTAVDVFAEPASRQKNPRDINENGLRAIPVGIMDRVQGESLSFMLQHLVKRHVIEAVHTETLRSDGYENVRISTYRDPRTDIVYEFVQHLEKGWCTWHPVPNPAPVAGEPQAAN